MMFKFWDPVIYTVHNTPFTSQNQKLGKWLGVAKHHGDGLCFWVLTNNTVELIVQGYLRKSGDQEKPNSALLKR
jgi:hypothetical protein